MAEKYRFFDAVLQEDGITYDREYDAQEFTDYFKALVTTGVMKGAGNQLAVTANGSNMITKIDTGIAFLLGRYYENDSFKELTHDTETLGNSRIDRIVVRMDLSTEARYVKAFIKKGTPSANPVPPVLTQTPNLYEISLAQVKIMGGQTFIATNAVTDERGKDVICPWTSSRILPNFNNDTVLTELESIKSIEEKILAILNTGWKHNITSIFQPFYYRKDGLGNVWLFGCVAREDVSPTPNITTLPVGYRPETVENIPVLVTNNSNVNEIRLLRITSNGIVSIDTPTNTITRFYVHGIFKASV